MKNIKFSKIRQRNEYDNLAHLEGSNNYTNLKNETKLKARELENFAEDKIKYVSNLSNASYETQYSKTRSGESQAQSYLKSYSNESYANPKAYKVVNFMQTGNSLDKVIIQGLEDDDERRLILYKIQSLEHEIEGLKTRLVSNEATTVKEIECQKCLQKANEQSNTSNIRSLKGSPGKNDKSMVCERLENCINEISELKSKLVETKNYMTHQLDEVRRLSYFEIENIHSKYHQTLRAYEAQLDRLSTENIILKSKLGKVHGILSSTGI